jgi:hypothetical protein
MRLREIAPDWPPHPSYAGSKSIRVPSAHEAVVDRVLYCHEGWLTFVCVFDETFYTYDIAFTDESKAQIVKAILEAHPGESLGAIGEVELNA